MRLIVVDRKKAGTIICLALFMVMLFVMEITFHNKLQQASFAQVTKGTTMTYKSVLNNKLEFSTPYNWNIKEVPLDNEDILYKAEIISLDESIRGIITVKNIPNDMDRFLEKNEEPIEFHGNVVKQYCIEKNQVLIKLKFNYDSRTSEKEAEKQIGMVLKSFKYDEQ
ncbi:MAG: hypothetical protein RSB70_03890 [Clostridium sp.]